MRSHVSQVSFDLGDLSLHASLCDVLYAPHSAHKRQHTEDSLLSSVIRYGEKVDGLFLCFWVVVGMVLVHFGSGLWIGLFSGAWRRARTDDGVPLGMASGLGLGC